MKRPYHHLLKRYYLKRKVKIFHFKSSFIHKLSFIYALDLYSEDITGGERSNEFSQYIDKHFWIPAEWRRQAIIETRKWY